MATPRLHKNIHRLGAAIAAACLARAGATIIADRPGVSESVAEMLYLAAFFYVMFVGLAWVVAWFRKPSSKDQISN